MYSDIAETIEALIAKAAPDEQTEQTLQVQPFRYATIPPDQTTRLAVPGGRTTINFDTGLVHNVNEGQILDDSTVTTKKEMARTLPVEEVQLRSIFVLADVPVHFRTGGGDWHEIDACNYYPLSVRDFSTVELEVGIPYAFELKVSTRPDPPFDVSGVSVHADRDGQFPSGGGTTQQDSYADMVWQPEALNDAGRVGDFTQANAILHTVSFTKKSWTIENDSGNGNAIDARVVVRRQHPGSGTYFEVLESTNIADGDHTNFDLDDASHFCKVQVRNNQNDDAISAAGGFTGVN